MAGRSARVRERALVDEDDVLPAQPGQVADQTAAHDAGADDDDVGLLRKFTHCCPLLACARSPSTG